MVHKANHEYILASMTRVNEARRKCELSFDAPPSSFETSKRSTSSHRTETTDQSSSDCSFDRLYNERSRGAAKQVASRSEMLKILTEADPEMTESQRLQITTPVKKKKVLSVESAQKTLMNPMDDDGNFSSDSFGFGLEEYDWWNSEEAMSTTPSMLQDEIKEKKPKVSEQKTKAPATSINNELSRSKHKEDKETSKEKHKKQHKDTKKHRTSIKVRASDFNRTSASSSSIDPKVIEAMKASGGGRRRISAKELEEMGVKVPTPCGRPATTSSSEHQSKQMKSRARSKSRGRLFVRSRSRGRVQGGESSARDDKSVRSETLGRVTTCGGEKQQQRSKSRGRVRETSNAKSSSRSVGRSRALSKARSTTTQSRVDDHSCHESDIPMTISIEVKPTDNKKAVSPNSGERLLRQDSIIKRASDQRDRRLPMMESLLITKKEDNEGNEDEELFNPTTSPVKSSKQKTDSAPNAPTRYQSPLKRLKRVFSGRFSPRRSPKKSMDVPGSSKIEASVPFPPSIKASSTGLADKKEGVVYSTIKSAGIAKAESLTIAEF